jgi:DNA-binding response OmpR family regulator
MAMNPPHILIVDDEPNVRFVLERTLHLEGYVLDSAASGEEALKKLAETSYDLLLLDLRMEPVDGLQVLNTVWKQDPDIIAIILTAHGSLESAVEALRLGAFDYLFKPATPEIIRQRVHRGLHQRRQALYRRRLLDQIAGLRQALDELETEDQRLLPPVTSRRFVHSGKLVIDRHHRVATLDDKLLDLTTTEFNILLNLVASAPQPISPRQLVNCAIGYDCEDVEARDIIKWHIHHLRRKIEPDPVHPCYIQTVRHKGYLWCGQ